MDFSVWRQIHRVSSGIVGAIALVHCAATFLLYDQWSPNAVWFLGTGIGMLTIATINFAHVGLGPCRQPTAPVVRWLDLVFVGLGVAALVVVPEPQAVLIVLGLIGQAVASFITLPGPARGEPVGAE